MRSKSENRTEGRSNVFLIAMLDTGATSIGVRIRNISSRGALIEGASLPSVGSAIRLARGSLSVEGYLAWHGHGNAGITFETQINVECWVKRIGHPGQQRIDGVVAAIRRSDAMPKEPEDVGVTDTLTELSAALEQTCERLAEIDNMSVIFAEELIKLDAIAQALRRLALGTKPVGRQHRR